MSEYYSEIRHGLPAPKYAPRPKPTVIPTAAWNEAPLFCLQVNDQWVSHILGVLTALDQPDTWIGTEEEIFLARQQVNEIMLALMSQCPPTRYSLWDDSTVPDTVDSGDNDPVNLWTSFHTSVAGNIHGIRFYKSAANTGEHTGYLYQVDETLLGSLTFADESADGWQTAYFAEPIAINACDVYYVGYYAPNGRYSYSRPFFTAEFPVPPLYADNGLYSYGTPGYFPFDSYEASNYFVDVIFEPTGADYLAE